MVFVWTYAGSESQFACCGRRLLLCVRLGIVGDILGARAFDLDFGEVKVVLCREFWLRWKDAAGSCGAGCSL